MLALQFLDYPHTNRLILLKPQIIIGNASGTGK